MPQGGSQYGVPGPQLQPPSLPDLIAAAGARGIPGHMMGISSSGGDSSVSAVNMRAQIRSSSGYEEFVGERFGDEGFAGEDGDRGLGGNRWPRQETIALLKIRSDMDTAFRDATLKAPLWEDVARKLAELGYHRSAKKCKEKFENVHKYYRRTKEARAGRQDGKSYRFFSELEALNSTSTSNPPSYPNPSIMAANSGEKIGNIQIPVTTPPLPNSEINPTIETLPAHHNNTTDFTAGIQLSSDSSSGEDSGNPTEDYPNTRKRKKPHESSTKKIMTFFENLMNQVIQKQEMLQQRFLEAIEKREQERMIKEEAWKRQEMARLSREQEIMMQERSISASRDAAVIAFLQKITGQSVQIPPENHPKEVAIESPQVVVSSYDQDTAAAPAGITAGGFDPTSSRWPKAEVEALIKLRSGLDTKYQENGPKGALWGEISLAMKQLGYNRSSKRCKEKWENINKYYKKVKESNKKRPEDAKTCPYYHHLDALYKKKMNEKNHHEVLAIMPAPATESANTHQNKGNSVNPIFFSGNDEAQKPEDLVMEMMNRRKDQQQQQQQSVMDDYHSENLERTQEDEEDEEDSNDDGEGSRKIGYDVQYEILTNPSTREASSFMAMVQ